jgi:hypothetical protein
VISVLKQETSIPLELIIIDDASTDRNAAPTFDPAAEREALGNYTLRQVEYAKQFLEIAATDHPLAERMLSARAVQQS